MTSDPNTEHAGICRFGLEGGMLISAINCSRTRRQMRRQSAEQE